MLKEELIWQFPLICPAILHQLKVSCQERRLLQRQKIYVIPKVIGIRLEDGGYCPRKRFKPVDIRTPAIS